MIIQANRRSRIISIVISFLFLAAFGLLAYLNATLENEINSNNFTISQSLAFSIKPAFVVVFTIACALFAYLMYYRNHCYLWIRLFILFVIYAFIITILWVTTYYNKSDHYILASFIFTFTVLFIGLNNLLLYNGLKSHSRLKDIFLITIPILAVLGLIGILISTLVLSDIPQIFPSFENYILLLQGISVLSMGFI
jgi:hypothetical protein